MKFPASNNFVCIVAIFFIVNTFIGCAIHQPSVVPPQRFKEELDALNSGTKISKNKYAKTTRHTVRKGETIWRIAYNYGVSPDNIIKLNHIKDVTNIKPGQRLNIPPGITGTKKIPIETTALTLTNKSNESFTWPLRGKTLTDFEQWIGGDKNKGIDIQAVKGQSVHASKGGIVALTSDTPDGWGKVVILQHSDGSYTWYAYNSKILVKKGDKVKQGQIIARAGSTGRAKQNKLHFKIFLHGVPVNPSYYLQ
ncbi:MAG: peptidoglycan DD-metalloendopeptidase family protein [Candidatus Scalinduaceae bacterium]